MVDRITEFFDGVRFNEDLYEKVRWAKMWQSKRTDLVGKYIRKISGPIAGIIKQVEVMRELVKDGYTYILKVTVHVPDWVDNGRVDKEFTTIIDHYKSKDYQIIKSVYDFKSDYVITSE